jgi:large subunit ribosomal protein L4
MATAKIYTAAGDAKGDASLPAALFDAPVHMHAMWEAVKCYNANQRQGTAATKTRATMSGGGRKPWRQKGTGRARSGTNTSPIWTGGGRAHGPHPRDFSYTIPKRIRRLAMTSALSARAAEGNVFVIDSFTMEAPKTKDVAALLKKLGLEGKKTLLVTDGYDATVFRSARNIPTVKTAVAHSLNAHDLLAADALVVTQKGLTKMTEVYA